MKLILLFLFIVSHGIAGMITPFATLKTDGAISDMVVQEGKIVVSTDEGKVDIFEVNSRKKDCFTLFAKSGPSQWDFFCPKDIFCGLFTGNKCHGVREWWRLSKCVSS